jgi:uncharacterized protein YgiM (DUF1202 family)
VRLSSKNLLLALVATASLAGCNRGRNRVIEVDYVSAPQVILRDELSQVYKKVGTAKNGDRVDVLDREKRFSKIRTANGQEGWVEQRYLVTHQVFEGFQQMQQREKDSPVDGIATTRNDTNPVS